MIIIKPLLWAHRTYRTAPCGLPAVRPSTCRRTKHPSIESATDRRPRPRRTASGEPARPKAPTAGTRSPRANRSARGRRPGRRDSGRMSFRLSSKERFSYYHAERADVLSGSRSSRKRRESPPAAPPRSGPCPMPPKHNGAASLPGG